MQRLCNQNMIFNKFLWAQKWNMLEQYPSVKLIPDWYSEITPGHKANVGFLKRQNFCSKNSESWPKQASNLSTIFFTTSSTTVTTKRVCRSPGPSPASDNSNQVIHFLFRSVRQGKDWSTLSTTGSNKQRPSSPHLLGWFLLRNLGWQRHEAPRELHYS